MKSKSYWSHTEEDVYTPVGYYQLLAENRRVGNQQRKLQLLFYNLFKKCGNWHPGLATDYQHREAGRRGNGQYIL